MDGECYKEKHEGKSRGGWKNTFNDLACRLPTTITRIEVMDKIEKFFLNLKLIDPCIVV
jgi:hypothetical protein